MSVGMPTAMERPRRVCAQKKNYDENANPSLADFLFSDDDGSDTEEDLSAEDESYDAQIATIPFNTKRGEDKWVGRRVCKVFPGHGDFEGIIYGVDEDDSAKGYRLFLVYYFDDADDGESMWPEEVIRLFIVVVQLFVFFASNKYA